MKLVQLSGKFLHFLQCISSVFFLSISTPYRNCDVSDIVTENNESNILQMLFSKTNLPAIRSYGTIGDPKVSR